MDNKVKLSLAFFLAAISVVSASEEEDHLSPKPKNPYLELSEEAKDGLFARWAIDLDEINGVMTMTPPFDDKAVGEFFAHHIKTRTWPETDHSDTGISDDH